MSNLKIKIIEDEDGMLYITESRHDGPAVCNTRSKYVDLAAAQKAAEAIAEAERKKLAYQALVESGQHIKLEIEV